MTRIAILGSGGREHALAWKFAQQLRTDQIVVLPGNGGTPNQASIDLNNFETLAQYCRQEAITLVVVGSEVPLSKGISDYFKANCPDIAIFGPTQAAARLESSKIWAKQFMQRHGVATARFQTFCQTDDALPLAQEWNGKLVIKYDGLAAGKGVFVCANMEQTQTALAELKQDYGNDAPFLVEERLEGYEVSLIGLTDGKTFCALHPSQDHKQLYNNDQGPNTGGMGVYCPFALSADQRADIEQNIIQPTLRGISAEGLDYQGFLYFGIMMTPQGARLLEYNARLGDPETEVLMPALKTHLLPIIQACLAGKLDECAVELHEGYWVDVVLVSGGYPKQYATNLPISGIEKVAADTLLFHAGTQRDAQGILRTSGGRVLNVVAHGNTLAEAIKKAYAEVAHIHFDHIHYRTDIGQRKQ